MNVQILTHLPLVVRHSIKYKVVLEFKENSKTHVTKCINKPG